MTSPPLDYTKLREIAERAAGMHGADQEHVFDVAAEFNHTFDVETVLALLADNARMIEAIQVARGILLYPTNEMLTEAADFNTTGVLAAADALLAVESGVIKPKSRQALSGASDHAD